MVRANCGGAGEAAQGAVPHSGADPNGNLGLHTYTDQYLSGRSHKQHKKTHTKTADSRGATMALHADQIPYLI